MNSAEFQPKVLVGAAADDRNQPDPGELRKQARFYETVLSTITDFAYLFDLQGRLLFANKPLLELWGLQLKDVVGKNFFDLNYPPELAARLQRQIQEVIATKTRVVDETPYTSPTGVLGTYEYIFSPVLSAGGSVEGVAGSTREVTHQKETQAQREALLESERQARSEAERASRMKDEFLATLSHEIRTPLNAILGWSQILRQSSDPDDLAEGLEVIERNARSQSQIIEDLLDMSRIISGKVRLDVQRLDLATIVNLAIETARPAADAKGIRLVSVLDPLHGVVVNGDANRIQQVLWNLLSNAVKFTPKGGRVQVLLQRINSHIEMSVTDNGEGIRPEFLPRVFDRFHQADSSITRRHGGLGLGLSIVKHLVELHGGSVRVTSAGLGHGATFIVELPLAALLPESQAEASRRHPRALPEVPSLPDNCADIEGVRVLVVDDEGDARALVKRLLEDCNAIVTTASSVDEALQRIEREKFDVLVSDIGMPGTDGYAFIKRVRSLDKRRGGDTPAIALTAYARAEDRVRAVSAGFTMHVAKPVEPVELITMVAGAAGRTGK